MPGTGLLNAGMDIASTSTTALFALGTEVVVGESRYRYVKASAAIAANDLLKIDTNDTSKPNAMRPTAALNEPVHAVANVAIASGSFGWVVVNGKAKAKVAASTAAFVSLGSSATGGTGSAITISATPTQAEVQRVAASAAGRGVITLAAEASGLADVMIV